MLGGGHRFIGNILNFIGGTLRYVYGNVWRTILNKKKFTFEEYIYGPKDSNYYDSGHGFNNIIIAIVFIAILFSFIV